MAGVSSEVVAFNSEVDNIMESLTVENNSLIVNRGQSEVALTAENLKVINDGQIEASYSIDELPTGYKISLSGTVLAVGYSFTQSDIDAGRMTVTVDDPLAPGTTQIMLEETNSTRVISFDILARQLDDSPTSDLADIVDLSTETAPLTVTTGDGRDVITTGSGDDYVEAGKGVDTIHLDHDENAPSADSVFYKMSSVNGIWAAADGSDDIHHFVLGEDKLILRARNDELGDGTTGSLLQALADGGVNISVLSAQENGQYVITGLAIEFAHDGFEGDGRTLTVHFASAMSVVDFFAIAGTVTNGVVTDYNLDFISMRFLDITKLAGILQDSLSYQSYVVDKTEQLGIVYGSDLSDELLLGMGVTHAYALGGDDIIDSVMLAIIVNGGEGENTIQALFAPPAIELISPDFENIQNLTTNGTFYVGGDDEDNFIDVRQMQTGFFGPASVAGLGGHDVILGGQIDNDFSGGEGDDHLLGGVGNDRLVGEAGNDKLYGGDGVDKFVLGDVEDGTDIVTDFNSIDRIIVQIDSPLAAEPTDLADLLTALGLSINDDSDRTNNGANDTVIMQGGTELMVLEGIDAASLHISHFEVEVV